MEHGLILVAPSGALNALIVVEFRGFSGCSSTLSAYWATTQQQIAASPPLSSEELNVAGALESLEHRVGEIRVTAR